MFSVCVKEVIERGEMKSLLMIMAVVFMFLTVYTDAEYDFPNYEDHPCKRECDDGVDAMICNYHFTLEYYYTLSKACYDCPFNISDCSRRHCIAGDGVSRPVLVANRMLPGPGIHVCKNDTIVVKVTNKLAGAEATTIHWHGVLQKETPYMDGVSMITQCPIPAHTSFTYRFKPQQPGTMFWHAHSGVQRSDGIFGALIIRQSHQSDPHSHLYDYDLPEHSILVNDWLVELTIQKFAAHHHDDGDNKPRSALINGKGALEPYPDPVTQVNHFTPSEVFKVEKGKRYRFRVASNGVLNCPLQFSVQDHQLYMISSDGYPFHSIIVDSFNIFAGERYDFVLHADRDIDNYLIHVRGLADCGASFKQAKQHAILKYSGAHRDLVTRPDYNDGRRTGLKLNPWNRRGTPTLLPVSTLCSIAEDDIALKPIPDRQFYIAMDFNVIDNQNFHHPQFYSIFDVVKRKKLLSPQMNHISTIFPPSPPLGQWSDLSEDMFCNSETVSINCTVKYCQCVHRLQVALGDVVEIILVDEGVAFNANHPMHLHGHAFRVVAMDRLGNSTSVEHVMELDKQGGIIRKLHGAVTKDSVTVPDGGYTVLRFHANNVGFWLFHCHVEFHIEIGMGLVIQVGSYQQMPRPPPNFPRCGNWDGGDPATGSDPLIGSVDTNIQVNKSSTANVDSNIPHKPTPSTFESSRIANTDSEGDDDGNNMDDIENKSGEIMEDILSDDKSNGISVVYLFNGRFIRIMVTVLIMNV
ncbi:uncharacterized protein LOC126830218 [Patella vulgata]|uniref:uncharacterized protein LOC126830218 n=1 Tax=Patella vulgata TaxID=6465 RepID=UPI00217F26BA|nr:uncharacterized protein LOC126830218 [Patella vulgata]XP_050416529.1 uncharacterized protein LOC126830218 [Patella vulgata]XP_050416536.1 uncharacterized protein LOC126830218 [Patella vulgata]XP_050416540.1 uncharacterized protein LOC126830218 [Patella vulgata]XP_050416548.1 uncharacterized protein LOC126830218 [Patella vulgata]